MGTSELQLGQQNPNPIKEQITRKMMKDDGKSESQVRQNKKKQEETKRKLMTYDEGLAMLFSPASMILPRPVLGAFLPRGTRRS